MRHAVPHDDHRVFGAGQQLRRASDQRRLRHHARLRDDRRQDRLVVRLVEDVLRNGEKCRTEGRRRGDLDATAQQAQQASGVDGARGVLGHRPGEGDEIERHVRHPARHKRRPPRRRSRPAASAACETLIEAAQRVAEADAGVHLHDGRLLRRQRIAVGDAAPASLPASPSMYRMAGKRATSSSSPSSLLPGLPNM